MLTCAQMSWPSSWPTLSITPSILIIGLVPFLCSVQLCIFVFRAEHRAAFPVCRHSLSYRLLVGVFLHELRVEDKSVYCPTRIQPLFVNAVECDVQKNNQREVNALVQIGCMQNINKYEQINDKELVCELGRSYS